MPQALEKAAPLSADRLAVYQARTDPGCSICGLGAGWHDDAGECPEPAEEVA
jgi:hypothetical protein